MIRIDGSEYSEKHSIARLIGAPPGYVGHDSGGQLTEYVRRKPYCIVLIDEIEKASREFVTLFLQVLDDGRLTDGQGRVVDFRNTVIVMTSNLGAAYLNDMGEGPVRPQTRQLVLGAIQAHFPPEFVNRIDEIIIFVSDIFCGSIETSILRTMSSAHFLKRILCILSPCA
jgi:ATP-dependent Clp protease ATP-binding subunit ClpB